MAGEGPGAGQWDHRPGLNPAVVPQERQNIIRYWLENLRAKQGESLHNIHFLEGQPISEYGAARHGTALPPHCPAPSAQPVPKPCRGGPGGHTPSEGPLSPRVPIPGAVCRAGWWVRGSCTVPWLGSAGVGHRALMCHGHPKPLLPVVPAPNPTALGPSGDTHGGAGAGRQRPRSPSLTPCPAAQFRSWRPAASSSRSSRCTSRGSSSG